MPRHGYLWAIALALPLMASAADAPRESLFDGQWQFLRGDAVGAEQPTFADQTWRSVDLPHDWSIEDLVTDPALKPTRLDVVAGQWRFAPGDDQSWKKPEFDDHTWREVTLPDIWENHGQSKDDNVYGWFRRQLPALPADAKTKGVDLVLGKIDDVDEAFVNGVRIGGSGSFPPNFNTAWQRVRIYHVPAEALRSDGNNVLAVRVFDGGSNGGIYATGSDALQPDIGPFSPSTSAGGAAVGYMVGGTGWYRKTFPTDAAWAGKRVQIQFDGVYMDSQVWCNGTLLGRHPYGYTSFIYDLTPHLRTTGDNVLAVKVDNLGANSRWYSGSGIYRHVRLMITDPLHISHWGVSVTTPEISAERATVQVDTSVENRRALANSVTVSVKIRNPAGQVVASSTGKTDLASGATAVVPVRINVKKPQRWSMTTPALYRAEVSIENGDTTIDHTVTTFGIRTLAFDAQRGFQLNGESIKLKGTCQHHDCGPLGAASFDRAEERKVEILKANGYNAIRCAHNPPSIAFLDACDRLGIVVMDEAFDMWRKAKNPDDYHRFFDEWWQRDIDSMVLRDRNHPSIILWSIGNEIPEQFSEPGIATCTMLRDRVHQLDPTRLVTQAVNGNDKTFGDQLLNTLDVAGLNYSSGRSSDDRKNFPERINVSTESFPHAAHYYWDVTTDNPNLIGDFVWTGMDYLGETGCGFSAEKEGGFYEMQPFPMYTGNCGDLDLCGFKKPQGMFRDVLWERVPLVIVAEPPLADGKYSWANGWCWPRVEASWNWPSCEGKTMKVDVYSQHDEVTLYANGIEIGKQPAGRGHSYTASFQVPYKPGVLKAVGHGGKTKDATLELATTGPAKKLRLSVDRSQIHADRGDLAYVTVEVLDAKGNVVPNGSIPVRFKISGAGQLTATGNGNASDPASFQRPERRTFRGRCLVVLRSTGQSGMMTLRAEADGLTAGTIDVGCR